MYKSIFIILAILTIIATACICIKQPQLHKTVFIYDSQFEIIPAQEVSVESQQVPIMEQQPSVEIKQQNIVVEQQPSIEVKQQNVINKPAQINQPVKSQTVVVKKQTVQNTPTTQTVKVQPQTVTTKTPPIDVQKIVANNQKLQNTVNIPQPSAAPVAQTVTVKSQTTVNKAPIAQQTKTPVQTTKTIKIMTAQEEEIAWNVWRSNLTNKIMDATNFPAVPAGTVFRFEFNVDKYGKITNVQTWSENSKYTPYAIQFMAPVIRNLQGRSILNFPAGTARTATKAYGAWKISNKTKYSSPNDYNDIEKITR